MTLIAAAFNNDNAIIFCGDSLITTHSPQYGTVKLTNKFRKIRALEIIINLPVFDNDGKIIKYNETLSELRCMVAFSGSTLVSQHIINTIEGHLRRIKLTHIDNVYKLLMNCEDNSQAEDTYWDEDIFNLTPGDQNRYLTKEFQVHLIKHCIEKIINEFIAQPNDAFHENWFRSDFIVALSCCNTRNNHLFVFRMNFNDRNVTLNIDEIDSNSVAIIGISQYNSVIINKCSPYFNTSHMPSTLLKAVCEAVDDNESIDLREIGYPVVVKVFDQFKEHTDKQKHYNKNPYS